MPRKQVSSKEILMALIGLIPWWGHVAIGLISALWLNAFCESSPAWLITGQCSVFSICVAAGVASAIARQERREMLARFAHSKAPDAIHEMSWREFEALIGESFRLQGYDVMPNKEGGRSTDGIDLIVKREERKYAVYCQQWKAFKVTTEVVRKFDDDMRSHRASGGFIITSGVFTRSAISFAQNRHIRLIDGEKLFGMLQQAKASLQKQSEERAAAHVASRAAAAVQTSVATSTPSPRATHLHSVQTAR